MTLHQTPCIVVNAADPSKRELPPAPSDDVSNESEYSYARSNVTTWSPATRRCPRTAQWPRSAAQPERPNEGDATSGTEAAASRDTSSGVYYTCENDYILTERESVAASGVGDDATVHTEIPLTCVNDVPTDDNSRRYANCEDANELEDDAVYENESVQNSADIYAELDEAATACDTEAFTYATVD